MNPCRRQSWRFDIDSENQELPEEMGAYPRYILKQLTVFI